MSSASQQIRDLRFCSNQLLEGAMQDAAIHVFQAAMVAWTTQATDGQLQQAIVEKNVGRTEALTFEVVTHPEVLQAIHTAIGVVVQQLDETYSVEQDR